jgi:cell wall-associated NlpC family hydrolase
MVDGNDELSGFPFAVHRRAAPARLAVTADGWDSRESPGPISEATLHRPSPSRALTAGAIALAVVTPALEPVEQATAAVSGPVRTEAAGGRAAPLDPGTTFSARQTTALRASRANRISAVGRRAARVRPAVTSAFRRPSLTPRAARPTTANREVSARRTGYAATGSDTTHRTVRIRRARAAQRTVVRTRVVTRHATAPRTQRVVRLGNMTAVIAYARSQVGKRYVSGGMGPNGFDCSGFTKSAYARVGIRLPHSSTAQAARARSISRRLARPGDLVVGPGHVGIYMGHGMMIDAGNHRTGVVYRKLYSGLRVGRL